MLVHKLSLHIIKLTLIHNSMRLHCSGLLYYESVNNILKIFISKEYYVWSVTTTDHT